MGTLFDHFDQIRIINLAQRTDRREHMLGELERVGLSDDPRVAFFDACRFDDPGPFSSKGARGCFQSHLAILEAAAQRGESVLILEDDVDFSRHVLTFALEGEWSIFYGGHYAATPERLPQSDISGSHFMGFSAEAAARLAVYLRELEYEGVHPPIDAAYVWFRRAFPDVPTVFAVPPLGGQRPSRTDVAPLGVLDRLPWLRGAVALARRLKRRLAATR